MSTAVRLDAMGAADAVPRMAARTLRIGTRGSALALAQAGLVEAALRTAGFAVETVLIRTAGDRRASDTAWGEGAFVREVEHALLDGRVDVAVHSAKDIPTDEPPGLAIVAYLPREDPHDALVCRERGRTLGTLPAGARVGTDSPRRTAFLLARRPDLRFEPLHGNVDTRLRRLDGGQADALVLAVAGLVRLGRDDRIGEVFVPEVLPPAPGQGALAVQVRADDELRSALAALDDGPTRLAVEAERAFLRLSGGGCRAPIGALATVEGSTLTLHAGYARADGSLATHAEAVGGLDDGPALAARVVAELEARVGERPSVRPSSAPATPEPPLVLVTRPAGRADALARALGERGLEPLTVPTIALVEGPDDGAQERMLAVLDAADRVVVTSPSGAEAILRALGARQPGRARWSAVGEGTADVLARSGLTVEHLPRRRDARGLADELPVRRGERVVVARAAQATPGLVEQLRARGAHVDEVALYRRVEGPEGSREALARVLRDPRLRAVVFASGSSVRGLLRLTPADRLEIVLGLPAVCIGESTAAVARRSGFRHVTVSPAPTLQALADAAREAIARESPRAGAARSGR